MPQPDAPLPDPSTDGYNTTIGDKNLRAAVVPLNSSEPEPARDAASSSQSTPPGTSSVSSTDDRSTASANPVASTAATAGQAGQNTTIPSSRISAASNTTRGKSRSSGTSSSPPAAPTPQQGFFNAITQRLQQVEANLTLSLKYVEDQSRHMQDALQRAEQKQSSKVTHFLDDLNRTVLAELRSVRDQYEQIWQSTVIALDSQRDQSERDIVALGTRLNILADEVVFQKRMAIVQAVLLLSCLFLVIFSRGVPIPYLAPLLEQSAASSYLSSHSAPLDTRNLYRPRPDTHRTESELLQMRVGTQYPADAAATRSNHMGIALSPPDNLPPVPEVDPEPAPEWTDYQPLSPSPTPSLPANGTELDPHDLGYESDTASLQPSPAAQFIQARKPLPALPEHPGSP